jgi:hypothetical protein
MSGLRSLVAEFQGCLDKIDSGNQDPIEAFFRESYYRTADLFHILARPLRHASKRWANSDRPGARFLHDSAEIAMYVIAYLLLFALHIVLGSVSGGPCLPGHDNANEDLPSEKSP